MNRKTAFILPFFMAAACASLADRAKEERVYAVRVGRPEIRTIAQTLAKTGSITSPSIVEISPKISGRIVSTTSESGTDISEGSYVKKGQLIASIDAREYTALRDAARAARDYAKAQLVDREREYNRTMALLSDDTATEQEADLAKTDFDCATADLMKAEADLAAAEVNLSETTIVAPMDGVVSAKNLYTGAMVSQSSVIYTITQMDPLKIKLDVPTMVYPQIVPGQTGVRVYVDAYPDEPVDLKITKKYPTANTITRTVTVEADLDNSSGKYTPGMYVRGEIGLNERPGILVVPFDCVLRNVDKYYVYKVSDGIAHATEVTVGVRYDDVIEIVTGVELDDVLVSDGIHRLTDGVKVRVEGAPAGNNGGESDAGA